MAGIAVLALTATGIVIFAVMHPEHTPKGDVIVVLGAGMDADGTLHRSTINRVERGAALFNAGAAARMHFSGGRAVPDGPGAGDMMAQLAVSLGVPADAITTENGSLSTLQNALFSKPYLNTNDRLILVTEGFHLPRAAASFWWMGMRDLHIVHSTRLRREANGSINLRMIGRETAAVWFNLGRAIMWSATGGNNDNLLQ